MTLLVDIGSVRIVKINGAAVAAIRERSGLTQTALAGLLGMSQSRVSELESSTTIAMRPRNAVRLAKALAVPLQAILAAPEGVSV